MSINKKAQRIDLDTEDNIYHLKVTSLGANWWLGLQPGRHWDTQERGTGAEGAPTTSSSQGQTAPMGCSMNNRAES